MTPGGRRRESDHLRPAGEILGGLLDRLGYREHLREREILAAWPKVAGEALAERSQALRLRRGVLFVRVASAAWCQELQFLKAAIIDRYAEDLGPGRVRDIRFTQH